MAVARSFLASPEVSILWHYFNSVSSAVASRLRQGSVPGEENLTFLLCELLDESSAELHRLDYPLSKVQEQLSNSYSSLKINVSFETHEFNRRYEHELSGADLGLVIEVDHPALGKWKGAALLQAKRLFPQNNSGRVFSINSRYNSFNLRQFHFLHELRDRYHAFNSIHYLWYNPAASAFKLEDAKIIHAFEALTCRAGMLQNYSHDIMERIYSPAFHGLSLPADSSQVSRALESWVSSQPALRLTCIDRLQRLDKDLPSISLKDLYTLLLNGRGDCEFIPFANYMLEATLARGLCSDPDWISLAKGEAVVPRKRKYPTNNPVGIIDELTSLPTPKHTLRFDITSTLGGDT
jgi:hypothetical protein